MAPQRSGFATLAIDGRDWRVFAARGSESDVQVYVGEQIESRADILRAVMRSVLAPVLVALPLLAAALWWAVRRGLLPLRRVATELERRSPQDLRPLAAGQAPAELTPLLAALNALFERIGALVQSERRFTADAAHELRTPVAAIRAQAQVALGAGQEPERQHALHATIEGCDRTTRLIEQLLLLARLDARVNTAVPSAEHDLAALTRKVAAELAPQALARGQDLEVHAADPCHVAGEPVLAAAMLRNLIDNALRYAPDAGRVAIRIEPTTKGVIWRIEDKWPWARCAAASPLGRTFLSVCWAAISRAADSVGRSCVALPSAAVRACRSWPLRGAGWAQVDLLWQLAGASVLTPGSTRRM